MSFVFEVLFLFWFLVLSLLSGWDEMDVCVELIANDVWSAEDDNTGVLSVGVDIFDRLYFKERPIYLPMVPMSTINRKYKKWGKLRKLNKLKYEIVLMIGKNITFGYTPY